MVINLILGNGLVMLDDLSVFLEVVNSGSISGASKKLGIHQSQVSRSIKKLESNFNLPLLYRDSRRMISTEYGRLLHESTNNLFTQVNLAIDNYKFLSNECAGSLNIIAPLVFVEHFITPNLDEFLNTYPNLKIFISTDYNSIDEYNSNFDLAISVKYPTKDSFVAKKYFSSKPILCAGRSYIEQHGQPKTIEDLDTHKMIIPKYMEDVGIHWNLHHETTKKVILKEITSYQLLLSSLLIIKNTIKSGYGIAPSLDFNVYNELKTGEVVRVLPDYHLNVLDFYLVRPNKFKNIKVEAFLKFLNKQIGLLSAQKIDSE